MDSRMILSKALGATFACLVCLPFGCGDTEEPALQNPGPATVQPGPSSEQPDGKQPFDPAQLPMRIDVLSQEPAAPQPPPLVERPLAPADRYARAFEDVADGPQLKGFDVQSFLAPNGLQLLRREVNRRGEAALFFSSDGEKPSHVARILPCISAAAAREALRDLLAGYQQPLESYQLGELGFAAVRSGQPFRILFVRGNLLLQAWALDDGMCDMLALAVEAHANEAPPADGEAAPVLRLELLQPARTGTPTELSYQYGGALLAVHFAANGDAWVDTREGKAWLLAPSAGEVALSAVAFDNWLRRSEAKLAVSVQE